MLLRIADFEGFKLEATQRYLNTFDSRTRKKGESYFRAEAVQSIECNKPGRNYTVIVLGGDEYFVSLHFDGGWDADCSCPIGHECKHIYAAVKQLLAEYSSAAVADLSATAGKKFPIPRVIVPPVPAPKPAKFADYVNKQMERKLTHDESHYLKTINQLFLKATSGVGITYAHELAGLGLPQSYHYWDRLELYPSVPRTEREFWNYLALYLTEKRKCSIPDFLEPFTDLTDARNQMLRLHRTREVERWKQTLERYSQPGYTADMVEAETAAGPVELRLRFTRKQMVFESRTPR